MSAQFNFSIKTTTTCVVLACLMVRASFWQYSRLQQKNAFIATLDQRLKELPVPIEDALSQMEQGKLDTLIHKRVSISGAYDFEHEMILRNRRNLGIPGALIITPLHIAKTDKTILVNRGFIPLKDSFSLEKFRANAPATFVGLLKENMAKKFLAPSDPAVGANRPFQVQWIRVNIPVIQLQLPYTLLPLWTEIMNPNLSAEEIEKNIVTQSSAGREDMLFLPGNDKKKVLSDSDIPNLSYPIPCYDTVIPPGRHREYVYEWAVMAFLTLLIGVILQLRRSAPLPK
jgi:cytochrome oxidase assembly protein ShyY1